MVGYIKLSCLKVFNYGPICEDILFEGILTRVGCMKISCSKVFNYGRIYEDILFNVFNYGRIY